MASPQVTPSALYRVFQFFVALKAGLPNWAGGGLSPTDTALAVALLTTPAQQRLFAGMSANDQRHAVAVVRTLQQAGYLQLPLLQAGLLHDVAKSLGQPILYRVAIVLLTAFWPSLLARISESANQRMANNDSSLSLHPSAFPRWRRPFIIHACHPAIGAEWAKEAGCEPLAVKLIARHQDKLNHPPVNEEEKLLTALQWADNLN